MIANLTKGERQIGIAILIVMALVGMTMAGAGQGDALGVHGLIIVVFTIACLFALFSATTRRSPPTIASTATTTIRARSASSCR